MIYVNIKKKLGQFKLDVNFREKNEVLSLLGPSGCGKSMTLKCIAGIEEPDSGQIILNGKTLYDSEKKINLSPQERNIGLLFQNYALFPNMTLRENILIGGQYSKITNLEARVETLISNFSLSGLENHYPHQLSGGQAQRVALARMLISNPKILMLDEPFSALDEHLKWQMERNLIDLIKEYEGPTIYVSHNKDEVYRISNSIAIMNQGQIIEHSKKESIFNRPRNFHTAILTGYKNISNIKKYGNEYILKNWNLKINKSKGEKYKKVGIREDQIKIFKSNKSDFILTNIIENFNSFTLIVKNLKTNTYSYISHPTNEFKLGDYVDLDIDEDQLIFLS